MYFYVDESGQSGNNLFDENQPWLYYGLLSSPYDLDVVAKGKVTALRKKLSVDELHASELGVGRLTEIVDKLEDIYQEFQISFDFFGINKPDYAVIGFFDQVFDQGMNPAVLWTSYWTPLRYVLLLKVAYLFDEELAKKSWTARIETNNQKAEKMLVDICNELLNRVARLPDERSREIIRDSLHWVIRNSNELGYNVYSKKNKLEISPNLLAFQYVVFGICKRLELSSLEAQKIIVDEQSEFNNVQKWITSLYQQLSATNQPLQTGVSSMPIMDLTSMPDIPIQVMTSKDSIGLEIVDIYLWIIKRFIEGKNLSEKLRRFIVRQADNCYFDCMSLNAISERWTTWFQNLPEPTEDELRKGREFRDEVEARRKPFIL